MKVLRTIYWVVIAFLATLLGGFCLPVLWFLKLFRLNKQRQRLIYRYAHWWGRVVLAATGSKVTVRGAENIPSGPVVFMANHLSLFDIMLLLGYIAKPIAFMAKKELAKVPVIRSLMGEVGCLYLDREDVRQAVKVFRRGAEQVRKGLSMVIFPEGTRSLTGSIGDFKSGSMKLAIKADVPIVPAAIYGTGDIFKDKKITPTKIFLQVMPSISPDEYQEMGSTTLATRVRDVVAEGWQQIASEITI